MDRQSGWRAAVKLSKGGGESEGLRERGRRGLPGKGDSTQRLWICLAARNCGNGDWLISAGVGGARFSRCRLATREDGWQCPYLVIPQSSVGWDGKGYSAFCYRVLLLLLDERFVDFIWEL